MESAGVQLQLWMFDQTEGPQSWISRNIFNFQQKGVGRETLSAVGLWCTKTSVALCKKICLNELHEPKV